MMKIAVIGAGVSGLGCAIRIKETFPLSEVIVITKDITPNTTGDGSAGLWGPFLLGSTPDEKIEKWSKDTHDFFFSLWREGLAGSCLIPCIRVNKHVTPDPSWKNVVYGYKKLDLQGIEYFKSTYSLNIKSGSSFVTFTCEPRLLLTYLMDRFSDVGGKIERRNVECVEDVARDGFDIVINCTGLGARLVVPDRKVIPIRGQVARVKASWIYHTILDDSDDGNYIIPNTNTVVLGGTHQENDYNLKIDHHDSKFIRDGCENMIPGLKNVDTLFEWVGLRPGRNSIRLERKDIQIFVEGKVAKKNVIVIHNYGHGGSGVTLFWGCAKEVVEILSEALKVIPISKI